MEKIEDEKIEEFEKESIFDLFRLFTQFTDIERVKTFYDFCAPLLIQNEKQKEQKKAYRYRKIYKMLCFFNSLLRIRGTLLTSRFFLMVMPPYTSFDILQ